MTDHRAMGLSRYRIEIATTNEAQERFFALTVTNLHRTPTFFRRLVQLFSRLCQHLTT